LANLHPNTLKPWSQHHSPTAMKFTLCSTKDASIKAVERVRRGSLNTLLEVKIRGPSTPVPKQWGKYIPNPENKGNLCDFLSESSCILGRQQLPPERIFSLLEDLRMADRQWWSEEVTAKMCMLWNQTTKKQTQGEINNFSSLPIKSNLRRRSQCNWQHNTYL